jgi:hypothetical protein
MRQFASVYTTRTKRRLLNGCLAALVGLPLMCCCLVLIGTVGFPALDSLAAGGDQKSNLFVILGGGLVVLVLLIAVPLVTMAVLTWRRARALDAVFTPLGLKGSLYMLYGRHYQGQIDGDELDVYIYRGPTVEVRRSAATQTRLQVMQKGSLPASVAGLFDKNPLATGDPALKDFSIFPIDPTWSMSLLADARAVEALQTLMTSGAGWAIFRHVEIQPGEVLLYLNRSQSLFNYPITSVDVHAWLQALKALVQAATSQPAPTVTAQALEASGRQMRQKKSNFLLYAVGAILFIMPLCLIAIGVIAYLVASMSG